MQYISIIITYKPDLGTIDLISELLKQNSKVIIVDNGSASENLDEIIKSISLNDNVNFLINDYNIGIAAALNQGVMKAKEFGYEWCFTFDQDSEISKDFIESIITTKLNTFKVLKSTDKKIAIIGPNQKDCSDIENNISFVRFGKAGWSYILPKNDTEVSILITSGSFINIDVLIQQGFFREDLFIDHVDTEYCIRTLTNGYSIILSHKAMLFHNLGEQTLGSIAGKKVRPTNHSALRRYYMIRNSIFLYKIYLFKKPVWVAFDILNNIKMIIKICLLEDDKFKKISSIFTGAIHGMKNKMGKYPDQEK